MSTSNDVGIRRVDERLASIAWPRLKKVNFPKLGSNDCLLVCAGFEDRSVESLKRICRSNRVKFTLGLIKYLPEQEENRTKEIREIALNANLNLTEFVYNRENPSGMGEELQDFSQQSEIVYVDISGMSRLLIVQLLVALLRERQQPTSIIYGEAEQYPPLEEEYNRDSKSECELPSLNYLSSGIFEIAITPELSSVSMLGHSIRLIAFPSFDPAQLSNLIQELQPTYTEFIHGIPPEVHNKWRTMAVKVINGRTLDQLLGKTEHEVSTLDYRETLKRLLDIYSSRSMFDRIVIAPTGSKMQAVAVGFMRSVLSDVQIVYPTPQTFITPKRYTLGLRQLYQLDIPIELIKNTLKTPIIL